MRGVLAGVVGVTVCFGEVVWQGPDVNLLGTPSRDGRWLSYVDPSSRELAVRDLRTGARRLLTKHTGSEYAYFSVISRDAKRVAYAWFNTDGFYELRVTGMEGGEAQVLYRNDEAGFVQPCAWTPDNRFVLTLFFRKDNISQIVLVPLDGGAPKVLRSLIWVYPKRMDLSADGKWIVYDSFAKENAGDRTIFLLAVDGSEERKLITTPGNYLFPTWDGKDVLFVSDHAGSTDLWRWSDGKISVVRKGLGRALPLGVVDGRRYLYGVRTGESDVFVTTLADPTKDAERASVRYPGRNLNPVWSQDGRYLAYLSRRGSENFGAESRAIVILNLETLEERELLPALAYIESVRWSSDGVLLLASGSDGKGRAGLYVVTVADGSLKPVAREADAPVSGYEGVFARAGIAYLYRGELRVDKDTAYRGDHLHALAASPDGSQLAFMCGSKVRFWPSGKAYDVGDVTGLEWRSKLYVQRGSSLCSATGECVELPGNAKGPVSVHPDGKRIALTASSARVEVHSLDLR